MKNLMFLCGILFFCKVAAAQTSEDIQNIENYLNNLGSMQATFVQMASNGATAEGRIFIKKPNKIRMEYAEPTNVLIVGNGDFITYKDLDLDQITNIDYDDIPLSLILSNKIKLEGADFKIIDFYKDKGSTSITLEMKEKSDTGPITLVFSNNPFELKQWKIVDPQSVEVTLSLYDAQKDIDIDEDVFVFRDKKHSSRNFKKKN
jgi:outer membrane lipoprotein-sorting protein